MQSGVSKGDQSVLMKLLQPLSHHFASAAGFSFFINMLMIVPAIYMLQVYDRAVGSRSTETLLMLTLLLVFLLSSMGLLDWVRSRILISASAKLHELLAKPVFSASFAQSLKNDGKQQSGQALSDLSNLRQFVAGSTLFAFFDAPWVPFYIAIMFLFHSWFGIMALVSLLLILSIAVINQYRTSKPLKNANQAAIAARIYSLQNLNNNEVISAMGMFEHIQARWQSLNLKSLLESQQAAQQTSVFSALSKTLRIILQSLTLGLGAYLAIAQEISPGMMIAGSILLGRALAPIDQLVGGWKTVQAARDQFVRLNSLLTDVPERQETMALPAPLGDLKLEKVSVLAPGTNTACLEQISFHVPAGSLVGIIGPSASGKTTLARTILGIWPTAVGVVRLDGSDIKQWDSQSLGPHVGYLPQDIELFAGTAAENIARFGELDSGKIIQAAISAGVHQVILRLPEGYDTRIGAGGCNLSAGQRQRIALARALYNEPSLIVLDEPNSNLDESGEQALEEALISLKKRGATILIISHRPRILEQVDMLLVLKDGRLLDYGAKGLVMQKYRQAVKQQPAKPQRPTQFSMGSE